VFDWLFEGRISVYILLGVTAALLFYVGRQEGQKRFLVAGGIVALLIGVYFLLDRLIETGREQVRRKLAETADAVQPGDLDRIMSLVSDRFSTWGMDRAGFRDFIAPELRTHTVEELEISGVTFPDGGAAAADGTMRVNFNARIKTARLGAGTFLVEATFGRDADGQWRLTGYQVSNPLLNNGLPLERPHIR
jgi:hypothetical protein